MEAEKTNHVYRSQRRLLLVNLLGSWGRSIVAAFEAFHHVSAFKSGLGLGQLRVATTLELIAVGRVFIFLCLESKIPGHHRQLEVYSKSR